MCESVRGGVGERAGRKGGGVNGVIVLEPKLHSNIAHPAHPALTAHISMTQHHRDIRHHRDLITIFTRSRSDSRIHGKILILRYSPLHSTLLGHHEGFGGQEAESILDLTQADRHSCASGES